VKDRERLETATIILLAIIGLVVAASAVLWTRVP
jgi:hypothetical protein